MPSDAVSQSVPDLITSDQQGRSAYCEWLSILRERLVIGCLGTQLETQKKTGQRYAEYQRRMPWKAAGGVLAKSEKTNQSATHTMEPGSLGTRRTS